MKKIEWPGIATAVGIILILALIVLGARDDFHLKEWQTVIASVIALTGGGLAYVSAMAKVRAENDSERRELDRKKSGRTIGSVSQSPSYWLIAKRFSIARSISRSLLRTPFLRPICSSLSLPKSTNFGRTSRYFPRRRSLTFTAYA